MGESRHSAARSPRGTPGKFFPRNFGRENLPPFGRVCVELFGADKTGYALAQRMSDKPDEAPKESAVRLANLYIRGKTQPSYEALMVVLDELRPRKRA